jgi:hypothetical protein
MLPRPRSRLAGAMEFGDSELPFRVDEALAEGFGQE